MLIRDFLFLIDAWHAWEIKQNAIEWIVINFYESFAFHN